MASMSLLSTCGACGQPFLCNPEYVPSLRTPRGRQNIFCRACVDAAHPERERRGLPPIVVHPLAYEPQEV